MAYVAGNADYERGRVNWARVVGSDGGYLEVYPSVFSPTSIIQPAGNGHAFCSQHGVGQVNVAYEGGYIYFFLIYYHFRNPPLDGPRTVYEFRIQYDSSNPWGLSGTRELWNPRTGLWAASNGSLVFDYEGGSLPTFGDCTWTDCTYNNGMRNFGHGTGDVQWNPERNAWLHVFYPGAGDHYYWQEATSLATGQWSSGAPISDTNLAGHKVPGPAIWYGNLSRIQYDPHWYIWSPIDRPGCGDTGGVLAMSMMTLQIDH